MSGSCLCLGVSGVSGVHCIGDSLLELVTAQSSSEPEPEDQGGVEAADQSGRKLARLDQSDALLRSRDWCGGQSEAGVRGQTVPGGDQDRSRGDLTRDT